MKEETIAKLLEIRRVLNEQYVQLMYVEAETEQDDKDLSTLKGMLSGARGILEVYAERLIKEKLPSVQKHD